MSGEVGRGSSSGEGVFAACVPGQYYDEVSERQWHDVLGVLKVQRDRLDAAYLRRWAAVLGPTDLLRRAYAATGVPPLEG